MRLSSSRHWLRSRPWELEAAKKGVEGRFLDGEAVLCEGLAEGVAVVLAPELGKNGKTQRAAPELEAKVIEEVVGDGHTALRTLYCAYCIQHSVRCQVFILSSKVSG